jgi:hypothetical protein
MEKARILDTAYPEPESVIKSDKVTDFEEIELINNSNFLIATER